MTHDSDNPITFFARTNWRNQNKLFGIRRQDRLSHMYVVGKTGTGKSTLLETMARQDLARGEGFALFDPHGDLVEKLLPAVPEERRDKLVYMNVPDAARPLAFNPLAGVPPHERTLAASGMLEAMKKLWADSWGPRLEHILRNALLCLLEQPEPTLADVLRLLSDKSYRRRAADRCSNPAVRAFWLNEFQGWHARYRSEAIAPVQNKVGAFLSNPVLHGILTQKKSAFDVRRLIDEGRVLLVNLAKGRVGEDGAALLGSLLVSRLGLAALSRADSAPAERYPFFLYLDEFQSFTTLSLANMLSELRKYGMGLVLAHQHLSQLEDEVRAAVLGNAGTTISFRVGPEDAELLAREFAPEIGSLDLMSLPNYEVYVRLMLDGRTSRPFSATTLPAGHWDEPEAHRYLVFD